MKTVTSWRIKSVCLGVILLFVPASVFADMAPPFRNNVQPRGSLDNSRIQFSAGKKGTVAFLGGSITEMNGYRPMVCDILKKRFPQTDFKFINAGIASTSSTTGAFRLERDVLSSGPIDLLFVEFAVNDDQDAHDTREECIRGMEGIIRHAREANPKIDIVVTYFVNESMLAQLEKGQTPLTMNAHETVAAHYEIPTIRLGKEVAEEISAGTLTWEKYGGVHPAPFGNAIAANMIDELFNRAWREPLKADAIVTAHSMPMPLDEFSYSRGRLIDPKEAQIVSGWTLGVPDWAHIAGGTRPRFTSIPMLWATDPGAEAKLSFEGTAVGIYVVAGPDAGTVEASIDGGPFTSFNLYHEFSGGLHYPWTVMFATDLHSTKHALVLRLSADPKNAGKFARIMNFVAN